MFQLSKEEADTISRSQNVTLKPDDDKRGHNIISSFSHQDIDFN